MKLAYIHPQEQWDEKKCERLSKRRPHGGAKGIVSSDSTNYGPVYGGGISWNGGCIREDEHYAREKWPLPIVPEGWEFVHVSSWGLRIQRKAA